MKLILRRSLLLVLLSCVYHTAAFAEPSKNESQMAFSLMNFHYKELDDDNNTYDREDGPLRGILVRMGKQLESVLMTGEFVLYSSNIQYDGQTQSSIPIKSRTDTLIYDFSLNFTQPLAGKGLFPEQLYYGMGYRRWDRNINDTKTDKGTPVSGLHEIYSLPYFMFGTRWKFTNSGNLDSTFDLRLTHTFASEMYVDLYDGATLDLGEKFGGRASVTFAGSLKQGRKYFIEPFFELWQIGKSDIEYLAGVGYILEPKSITNNLGINIGLQW